MWALLTCAIAAVTAFMGYSVGASVGGGETGAAQNPPPIAAPAFLPMARIYESAREDGYEVARDRAYRAGRREGQLEGRRALKRAGFPKLRPGGFYLVRISRGPSIASRAPVTPGRAYILCRSAKAVCERPARP
jgi:hypothetical protein